MKVIKEEADGVQVVGNLHYPLSDQIRATEPVSGLILDESLGGQPRPKIEVHTTSDNNHSCTFDAERECKYFHQSG